MQKDRLKAIKLVYDAEAEGIKRLVNAGIDDGVLRLKSIEAMKDVANGRATKIFIPNDLTGSIGAAACSGKRSGSIMEFQEKAKKK